ncbi:hypothetical protein MUP01_07025 [Candidatus Bathyarchaeota archaeon]|nr:hypothetical protein [Candidatus Bathyarchaeota archaeon]
MPTAVKARDKDYARLKKYSEKHGVSLTEALAKAISTMEAKKLESEVEGIEGFTCDECGATFVEEDADYCPYCGVEFEDEDKDEDEED